MPNGQWQMQNEFLVAPMVAAVVEEEAKPSQVTAIGSHSRWWQVCGVCVCVRAFIEHLYTNDFQIRCITFHLIIFSSGLPGPLF